MTCTAVNFGWPKVSITVRLEGGAEFEHHSRIFWADNKEGTLL